MSHWSVKLCGRRGLVVWCPACENPCPFEQRVDSYSTTPWWHCSDCGEKLPEAPTFGQKVDQPEPDQPLPRAWEDLSQPERRRAFLTSFVDALRAQRGPRSWISLRSLEGNLSVMGVALDMGAGHWDGRLRIRPGGLGAASLCEVAFVVVESWGITMEEYYEIKGRPGSFWDVAEWIESNFDYDLRVIPEDE